MCTGNSVIYRGLAVKMMLHSRVLLPVGLVLGASSRQPDAPEADFAFCIIGAGVGGLQLGSYMLNDARFRDSYVVFERNHFIGNAFHKLPPHGRLISINKRHSGRLDNSSDPSSHAFNLRFDWNSLLHEGDSYLESSVPEVTKRTKERFPRREVVREYLQDFAAPQLVARKIRLGTEVVRVLRSELQGLFEVRTRQHDARSGPVGTEELVRCTNVVMAHGLEVPNVPENIPGIELARGYETLTEESSAMYEGKRVAVLGSGNAGAETVNALSPYVAFAHMYHG